MEHISCVRIASRRVTLNKKMIIYERCQKTSTSPRNMKVNNISYFINDITYIKIKITVIGISTISVNAANLSIFLDSNSTKDIRIRAPHHEFCPKV